MLRRSIIEAQVGHAYLFAGPEGIGKRATALAFAMALNCTDSTATATGDACGQCRSCRLIGLGQHPDVRLFTPETTGGKTVIPIDAIRTKIGESSPHPLPLREDAQLKPLEGRQKVYIIDPANRPGLQEDAGNALLMTLEEPPPHVVIILISSPPSAVLPTLVSRCLPMRFHLAPQEAIIHAISGVEGVSPEQAKAIAGMASGRIGWALAVVKNPQILDARRQLLDEIDRMFSAGKSAALRMAEVMHSVASSMAADNENGGDDDGKSRTTSDRAARRNLPELLDIVGTWWRDMLVTAHAEPSMRINGDYALALDRAAGRMGADEARAGLQAIMKAKRLIERNANIDLTLEWLWMTILPR